MLSARSEMAVRVRPGPVAGRRNGDIEHAHSIGGGSRRCAVQCRIEAEPARGQGDEAFSRRIARCGGLIMSLKDESTLRVVLYEGEGAQPFSPDERLAAMTTLLERGYSVTRTTTRGNVAPADRPSLLVLGKFERSSLPPDDVSNGTSVRFKNLDRLDGGQIAGGVEMERQQR